MNEVLLFGVAIPSLVALLVQMLKTFGMDTRFAPAAALVSGIVLTYLAQFVDTYPQIVPYVYPIIYGLVVWGSSTGLYELGKKAGQALGWVDRTPVPGPKPKPPVGG